MNLVADIIIPNGRGITYIPISKSGEGMEYSDAPILFTILIIALVIVTLIIIGLIGWVVWDFIKTNLL